MDLPDAEGFFPDDAGIPDLMGIQQVVDQLDCSFGKYRTVVGKQGHQFLVNPVAVFK